jgi:hypothetical protein
MGKEGKYDLRLADGPAMPNNEERDDDDQQSGKVLFYLWQLVNVSFFMQ